MPKRYIRVNNGNGWKNKPSVESPLNQINLNQMDKGIDDVDTALNNLENNLPQRMSEAITAAESIVIGNLTAGVNSATSAANTATTNANNAATNANNKASLADQKAQAAQSVVDAATPIVNTNLQATYADKATGLTGTAIQCVVADDALVDISSIKGASTQVVTQQGKNLFDQNKAQYAQVTYNGTYGNYGSGDSAARTYYMKCSPNTTYTAGKSVGSFLRLSSSIEIPANGIVATTSAVNSSGGKVTITTGPNDKYLGFYILLAAEQSTITWEQILSVLQIEIGSNATAYESFVPNSPSPDYPSPITSAGDAAFDIVTCNKNLLKLANGTYNSYGVTAVVNDGVINVSGTATANSFVSIPLIRMLDGKYVLSANNDSIYSTSELIRLESPDISISTPTSASLNALNSKVSFTINKVKTHRLTIRTGAGNTVNYTMRPQLERADISTAFEVGKENKLTVSGLPMNSLPNGVCDEVVRNADGSYKHIQRIGKVTLNGSEAWSKFGTNAANRYRFSIPITGKAISGFSSSLVCTNYKSVEYTPLINVSYISYSISGHNTANTINISSFDYDVLTTAEFKAMLAANPTTLFYELATPIETPLPSSYKLTSYKGVTNVFTTAPVQPVLTADFRSELWKNEYYSIKQDGNKAIDHLTVGSRKAGSTVGTNSFASGRENESSGSYSASEGQYNIASGINGSRAGGNSTKATGESSHSDGVLTEANAFASSAEGFGTKANGSSQSVVGRFNLPNTSDLFQIGMGTSDSDRKNAMRVTSVGDVIMAGLIKSPSFKWLGFVYPSDINNLYVAFTDSVDACAYGCFLVDNGLALIIGYEYTSGMYGYQLKMMFDNTFVKRNKYNSLTWSSWAPIA